MFPAKEWSRRLSREGERRERNRRWKVGDGGWVGDVLVRESEVTTPIHGDAGETAADQVAAMPQQPWGERGREKAVVAGVVGG